MFSRLLLVSAASVAVATIVPTADGMLEAIAAVEDRFSTYVALGASAIAVSEFAPIFGGIAAQEGQLRVTNVITAITLGGWIATTLLYVLGRLKWEWLRRKWPTARSAGTVALRVVRRNPARASFIVRFLFGGRILLPIACGAARVPLPVYLPMSLLGSLAWTLVFVLVGIAAGEAAEQVLGRLKNAETVVMAVGASLLVFAGVWWWRRRERRTARRAAASLAKRADP
jgi:membrane protein DedA with SNARE-associated domain